MLVGGTWLVFSKFPNSFALLNLKTWPFIQVPASEHIFRELLKNKKLVKLLKDESLLHKSSKDTDDDK